MELHEDNLIDLAEDVREHVASIEQDVDGLGWYLVGGSVRDVLMDKEPNDFDFVVVGSDEDEMESRDFIDTESSSFPVWVDDDGMEWALARTENKTGSGYKSFDVETEDVSLGQDLRRRDLTINNLAMSMSGNIPYDDASGSVHVVEPNGARLIDRHDGRWDLAHEQLRPVNEKFKQDPIRVMRLSRYAARFEFDVTQRGIALSREVAYELNRCSRERVGEEVVKALEQAEEPRRFFEVLRETGALAVIWPELDRADLIPAGPRIHHSEGSVWDHSLLALDRMNELCEERGIEGNERVRRMLMILAHDAGKVGVASDAGGIHSDDPPRRFGGHAERGAEMVPYMADRLGLEEQYVEAMKDACRHHMDFHDLSGVLNDADEEHNVEWAFEFITQFECEHDPGESTVYGATPEEMLDVAHSDHEGRLELEPTNLEDYEHLVTENTAVRSSGEWTLETVDRDIEFEEVRPEFDRTSYERVIDAVCGSLGTVDGYTIMREGLCEEHESVADDMLAETMGGCDDCRTPGPWIGNRIDDRRIEAAREVLDS